MALPPFKAKVDCLLHTNIRVFGEPVNYRPKKGGPYTLHGVFDRNFVQVDPDTEAVIASNVPSLGINLNEMHEKPEQGDEVRIYDEYFVVTDSQEDGQGGATLILQKIDNEY